MFTDPQVSDFKAYFTRDFPYGATSETVMDSDIAKAIVDAQININPVLWPNQALYTNAYLNLSAHYLVLNLRSSSQGIKGQYSWTSQSKSVGSVTEAFSIPQKVLDVPEYAMLAKTNYGAKYLFMVLPLLKGAMFTSCGRTQA